METPSLLDVIDTRLDVLSSTLHRLARERALLQDAATPLRLGTASEATVQRDLAARGVRLPPRRRSRGA